MGGRASVVWAAVGHLWMLRDLFHDERRLLLLAYRMMPSVVHHVTQEPRRLQNQKFDCVT